MTNDFVEDATYHDRVAAMKIAVSLPQDRTAARRILTLAAQFADFREGALPDYHFFPMGDRKPKE